MILEMEGDRAWRGDTGDRLVFGAPDTRWVYGKVESATLHDLSFAPEGGNGEWTSLNGLLDDLEGRLVSIHLYVDRILPEGRWGGRVLREERGRLIPLGWEGVKESLSPGDDVQLEVFVADVGDALTVVSTFAMAEGGRTACGSLLGDGEETIEGLFGYLHEWGVPLGRSNPLRVTAFLDGQEPIEGHLNWAEHPEAFFLEFHAPFGITLPLFAWLLRSGGLHRPARLTFLNGWLSEAKA